MRMMMMRYGGESFFSFSVSVCVCDEPARLRHGRPLTQKIILYQRGSGDVPSSYPTSGGADLENLPGDFPTGENL